MSVKDLLPIGSVVMLKDGTKPLMIFGVKQIDESDSNKVFDYVSVSYPEGNIGIKFQFLFNHSDIDNVLFRGFEDETRKVFIEKLSEII